MSDWKNVASEFKSGLEVTKTQRMAEEIVDLRAQLAESQAREADLIGVIKELVATLEHIKKNAHFTGPDLDAADALASTREIRERIGAV